MPISRREFVASSAAAALAANLPRIAYAAAAGEPDVIVIGAGLSGLETALTLEENGLKVLTLEGRRRVGGRVYTFFDVPGHPEVGGNTIANAYGRMIGAARKYGVETVNLAPRLMANRAGQELFLRGEHIPMKDWPTHARNPFAKEHKTLAPWTWMDAMLKAHMPFRDLENWYDPKYAQYDISLYDFLRSRGATDEQIQLGLDTNIAYGTTSHDVSLLMQAFADYWQQVNRGAVVGLSRDVAPPANPMANLLIGAFKGGNQNLPIAMARKIKGDLLQGKRVAAIEVGDRSATVSCADGSSYRARAVVCSMPFATLRHVHVDPLPPSIQNKAIQTLGYIPITQFHLVPKKPFWLNDGLSPSMWTDGPLGMVLAQKFGKTDDEVTSLTVWCRGANANFIDRLGRQDGAQLIVREFERLRPAAKGLLQVGGVHSWSLDPFAAGDWAIYQPGQVTAFASTMAKPHQRLFFCGEHTAIGSRGMEGALESAERVSLEVLEALG
jgi:monoamine oxidase